MTLSALAALAGVSVSTVSKAFSGSSEISENTKNRIFAIAQENGVFDKYNKNKFPKRVIAILCPEVISEYYSSMTEHLIREASSKNAIACVSITHFDKTLEAELYAYYSSYSRVDGIILISSRGNSFLSPLEPTVSILPTHTCEGFISMHTDLDAAIKEAVLHLKSLGHTRLGFAGDRLTTAKLSAFKAAVRVAGLPVNNAHICTSEERFERAGTDIAKRFIRSGDIPTAIIAAYDYIALGIIRELTENGYRIPEDISVIGMDDIAQASYLPTSLSSIHSPTKEICKKAVDLIMKKIDNPYYHLRERIVIPSRYIPRESTGSAPKK